MCTPAKREDAAIASLLKNSPFVNPSAPDQSPTNVCPSRPSKWSSTFVLASPWKIPTIGVNAALYLLLLDILNSSIWPVNPLVPA